MPASEFLCEVSSFVMLTPTVFEIKFKPKGKTDPNAQLAFEAGQFVSIVIPGAGPNGRDLRRAYSIASNPEQFPIELCVKLVEGGPGTNYLYKLRPGDTFRGYAPYGDFVFEPKAGKHACFISTGTGIAPFRSMILSEYFKNNMPASATMLFGCREFVELLYDAEMKEWVKSRKNFKWVPCLSRPENPNWTGFKGRVTDYLRSLGEDYPWTETDYYLCGGGAMIDEVKSILTAKGVQKESIHQEVYYKEPK
ncbi:MAG: hypothetical protein JNL01_15775 [Bdellovibrionales bacterium]|nr:hypothetical protein [Bdellovibrionales bacterium]